MLKRIYIDNFRCFVNFELSFDSINLFLGPNGAGKSTLFDALRKIQAFINGDRARRVFKSSELTRWQTSPVQTFELEIEGNEGFYKYELVIEYKQDNNLDYGEVSQEHLWFNGQPLLKFEAGNVVLFDDKYAEISNYPFGSSQSAVALVPPQNKNTKLTWFRNRLTRLIIIQINPQMMKESSHQENTQLYPQMENFVSWYRHISQDQGKTIEITTTLQEVIDGFEYFKFVETGKQSRFLTLRFSNQNNNASIDYGFEDLSDGQRALIALYSLIYYAKSEDYTLCIDEPENFLALSEIQPWLTLLYDFCNEGELQALLISHHPNLIDRLATPAGYWFDRESNRPVRVKRITEDEEGGVPISELVARGWLYG